MPPRPCNTGPPPSIDAPHLARRLIELVAARGGTFDLEHYENASMTSGSSLSSLVSCGDILCAFAHVQSSLRGKPADIVDALLGLLAVHSGVNSTKLGHQVYAPLLARKVICLLYHFRREAKLKAKPAKLKDEIWSQFCALRIRISHIVGDVPTPTATTKSSPATRTLRAKRSLGPSSSGPEQEGGSASDPEPEGGKTLAAAERDAHLRAQVVDKNIFINICVYIFFLIKEE